MTASRKTCTETSVWISLVISKGVRCRLAGGALGRAETQRAVVASAAFPPHLSPAHVKLPADALIDTAGADLLDTSASRSLCLTGGIYDNVGLEPVWKRYRIILVSDGGAATPSAPFPRKTGYLSLGAGHRAPAGHQHEV